MLHFLSRYRLANFFLCVLLLAGCAGGGPVATPEASRAEAVRLGAKLYSGEIPSGNSAAVVRATHDTWLKILSGDGQKVGKGKTVLLDETRFSLSGEAQNTLIDGQPIYEIHGFVEPVAGKPNSVMLNVYHSVIQNPDSAMQRRVSLENAANSLPTRQSMDRIWERLLPALQRHFAGRG